MEIEASSFIQSNTSQISGGDYKVDQPPSQSQLEPKWEFKAFKSLFSSRKQVQCFPSDLSHESDFFLSSQKQNRAKPSNNFIPNSSNLQKLHVVCFLFENHPNGLSLVYNIGKISIGFPRGFGKLFASISQTVLLKKASFLQIRIK